LLYRFFPAGSNAANEPANAWYSFTSVCGHFR
jgi:hypothetical protein